MLYSLNCRHCLEIRYKTGKGIKLNLHLVLLNDSRVQEVTFFYSFIHFFAFVLHGWYTTTGRSNHQKHSCSKYQLEPVLLQTNNTISILYNFSLYITDSDKRHTKKIWNFSSNKWMWCRTFSNLLWHGEDCVTELCQ